MKYHIEELDRSSNWRRKGKKTFHTYSEAERYAAKLGLSDDTHIFRVKGEEVSELEKLTDDERDVLHLVLKGVKNVDIARQLGMGLRTVEARRHSIMRKLKTKKVADLVLKVC